MTGMRMLVLPMLAMLAIAGARAAEPVRASALDYTLPESRDRPIVCSQGDIERFPGQSLAEVFGKAWPVQPQPSPAGERVRAQLVRYHRNQDSLKGLPSQRGLVVAAVLVDASGRALAAEPICATTEGYDLAVQRLVMRASYRPASIEGTPVTSVAMVVVPYGSSTN